MKKLVYGFGRNDVDFPVHVDKKRVATYELWVHLLARCYSPKCHSRQPTYKGCSTSENFNSFKYFHNWAESQIGFNQKGFHLDKDLLLKGNKVYSEDTCVFIPLEINGCLIKSNKSRGQYPIGVYLEPSYRKPFIAKINSEGKRLRIGSFDNPTDAFYAYKQAKEAHIKTLAEEYKHLIDPRAYQALLNYQVEITD